MSVIFKCDVCGREVATEPHQTDPPDGWWVLEDRYTYSDRGTVPMKYHACARQCGKTLAKAASSPDCCKMKEYDRGSVVCSIPVKTFLAAEA